jgi:hypothetical protein
MVEYRFDLIQREIIARAGIGHRSGIGKASATGQVAAAGDLDEADAGVLLVLGAEAAVVRTPSFNSGRKPVRDRAWLVIFCPR